MRPSGMLEILLCNNQDPGLNPPEISTSDIEGPNIVAVNQWSGLFDQRYKIFKYLSCSCNG